MTQTALNFEIAFTLILLAFTIFLFVRDKIRVDVVSILVLVILGICTVIPGLESMLDPKDLFIGFKSNAVVSIMAVMIIGAGLEKTAVMNKVAGFILKNAGQSESKIIAMVSTAVGIVSSFMQNVGAAALFIPVLKNISQRVGIPLSRSLIPMAFAAILGGTITLVASGPLILLNDLIKNSNQNLDPAQQMAEFGMFEVTPLGIALLLSGIIFFFFFGNKVLPSTKGVETNPNIKDYLQDQYGINAGLHEMLATGDMSVKDMEGKLQLKRIVAVQSKRGLIMAPDRNLEVKQGDQIAFFSDSNGITNAEKAGYQPSTEMKYFDETLAPNLAGVSEILIPPDSPLIGKTALEVRMRQTYGINLIGISRDNTIVKDNVRSTPLKTSDVLISYTSWEDLSKIEPLKELIVLTRDYPKVELRPHKVKEALFFFALAIGLVLFSPLKLPVSLFIGAIGMILTNVLSIDDAYKAISWKTIFLLAGLIPLGLAVENTGTANFMAQMVLKLVDGFPVWALQLAVGFLAMVFSSVMSNVGATVLLVPLAVNIALGVDADPRAMSLLVAVGVSNAFIIPTHQVNALVMGPGGYQVKDFVKVGTIMSIIFLIISVLGIQLLY